MIASKVKSKGWFQSWNLVNSIGLDNGQCSPNCEKSKQPFDKKAKKKRKKPLKPCSHFKTLKSIKMSEIRKGQRISNQYIYIYIDVENRKMNDRDRP